MATPLSHWLELLSDIGIVNVAPPTDAKTSLDPTTVESASPSIVTGSLGAGIPPLTGPGLAPPQQQPPIWWKAIGFCLKNSFTSSGSLSDDNRALFFGEPNQCGIPDGTSWPEEVTNFQVFLNADTMQRINRPTFSLSGSSYFEFLNLYLKNVGEKHESADLVQARQSLVDAKFKKDAIWEECRTAYAGERSSESLITYIDSSKVYNSAWEAEETAEQAFSHLRKSELSTASALLETLRLADMRLKPQIGNNMPVIATDKDWLQSLMPDPQWNAGDLVDPRMIFYRPLYSLPAYETTSDYWVKSNAASGKERSGPWTIPLAGIWDRSWSDLGHPLLDQAKPQETFTDEQKTFINSLTASLTFLQSPYSGTISPGSWNVTDLRARFPLQPDAPPSIKAPVCKTSKLILAWGVEIELTVPETISVDSITLKNVTLAAMDLPLRSVTGNGNKLTFRAGGEGIPVLVGALADVI